MKYYRDINRNPYTETTAENITKFNLIEISEADFKGIVSAMNTPSFDEIKTQKITLIDTQTASAIEALIGDNNKQKDLLATYNYLLEKKFEGDITADEIEMMNTIKTKWLQVSELKTNGNAKETEASNLLLEDYETLEKAILAVEAL